MGQTAGLRVSKERGNFLETFGTGQWLVGGEGPFGFALAVVLCLEKERIPKS